MKIKITQEDIDNGRRAGPAACPLALALRRRGVLALVFSTYWRYPSGRRADGSIEIREFPLNDKAKAWLFLFDARQTVKPVTLEL